MYAISNQTVTAAEAWYRQRGIIRYPEPAVEVLDPRFAPYSLGIAALE